MLAPVTEAQFGESALTALLLEGARRWPDFAAALESASGQAIGYDTSGTVTVALDASDRASLDDLLAYQHSLGLRAHRRSAVGMPPPGARAQPVVARRHRRARRPPASTTARCSPHWSRPAGRPASPSRTARSARSTPGPELVLADGRRLRPDRVVLAAGVGLADIAGLDAARARGPPGQGPHPAPGPGRRHGAPPCWPAPCAGLVRGHSVYLVPRPDGSLVVGATVEERGTDTTVQAGAVHELLCDARAIVPGVDELELLEAAAGLRPARPTTRRASAGAGSTASCSPPATTATGSCWRR